MTAQSRLPDLLEHLYDTLSIDATLIGAGVQVVDGPPVATRSGTSCLLIGATGLDDDDDPAAASATELYYIGGGAGSRRNEDLSTRCALWVAGGDTDMRARRRAAFDLFDAIGAALRASAAAFTAAGKVRSLYAADLALRQLQSTKGATVVLTFTVAAKAFI